MKLNEKVTQAVESGVEPIALRYETVRFFDTQVRMFRSKLLLNSLELGVLSYDQYRFVAARSKQGDDLVRCHVIKLLREITRQTASQQGGSLYSMPVYARTLREGLLCETLIEGFSLFPKVSPSQICIELSADVLFEDIEMIKGQVSALRDLGVKIAVCEVGDEFCPVFRLAAFPFEYAFLDSYATDRLLDDSAERTVGGLVQYLHAMQVRVIAPLLRSAQKLEAARALECDGYTVDGTAVEGGGL